MLSPAEIASPLAESLAAAYRERRRREASLPRVFDPPMLRVEDAELVWIWALALAAHGARVAQRSRRRALALRAAVALALSERQALAELTAELAAAAPATPGARLAHVLAGLTGAQRGGGAQTIKRIVAAAGVVYRVPASEILSARRDAKTVRARHAALYLARLLTPLSLHKIGESVGVRDHTSVRHAVRKLADRIARDAELDATLATIARLALRGGAAVTSARHAWGPPSRTYLRTERICLRCGLTRVTRSEPAAAFPWTEFWRGGARLDPRPACQLQPLASNP